MPSDMKGRGSRANSVSTGSIDSITVTTSATSTTRFMEYMMAGPRYIRTWLTSSLMRFIKSPVSFRL